MFTYYVRLGIKSMHRNPILSALMVVALALGIGACMTTLTVYYLMSGNPVPHKSDQLYAVQLDGWDPNAQPTQGPQDVQPQLTYMDAQNLMSAQTPALQQAAMFRSSLVVQPEDDDAVPFQNSVRATYHTFFDMFDVPFIYGNAWTQGEDQQGARIVVLGKALNEQLFGGENSVGRDIRLSDQLYRVIGVIDEWQPTPRFYDVVTSSFADVASLFIPFKTAVDLELNPNGNVNCWKPLDDSTNAAFLRSECVWVQFWAELSTPTAADAYFDYLNNYSREQQGFGRFQRPINNFISPVMEWMDVNQVVSTDNRVLVRLSFLFLAVCVLNTVGLLLAKFMGKAPEVALRRSMGATRQAIFTQNLFEVATIGVLGGVFGIALAWLGLRLVENIYRGYQHLVAMDWMILLISMLIAVVASIIAGLYPVWRTTRIPPAQYLKIQ